MICSVLLKYPDEFISNTKVVRNRSNNPDTQPTRVWDVHDTSGMIFPPPDTLSGNHPEPVFHPRMNSSSELIASYYVRSSFAFHLSCDALIAMIAVYLLFLPPLSPVAPAATADYTAAVYDYVVDDSTPTVELPGKQCPFPSPIYRLSVFTLSVALGIAAVTCLPIQLHSLSFLPFVIL